MECISDFTFRHSLLSERGLSVVALRESMDEMDPMDRSKKPNPR